MNKHQYLTRDIALRAVSKCGNYRMTAVTTTNILQQAITRHKLFDKYCKYQENQRLNLLGHVISFSNATASWLRDEERVHSQFFLPPKNPDSLQDSGSLICEALALGESRAFAPFVDLAENNENNNKGNHSSPSLTAEEQDELDRVNHLSGVLKVQRIMYRQSEPVLSATKWNPATCNLDLQSNTDAGKGGENNNNEIDMYKSLTPHAHFFFQQSDGIPTACFFSTHIHRAASSFDDDDDRRPSHVSYSGGVLLQAIAASASTPSSGELKEGEQENEFEALVKSRMETFERICQKVGEPSLYLKREEEDNKEDRFLALLHKRASTQNLLLQDLLTIASGGNKEDSIECCVKARHQNSKVIITDVAAATTQEEEDKEFQKLVEEIFPCKIELDTSSVTRSSIDFFCRCKKTNDFMNYLKSLGSLKNALQFLKDGMDAETPQDYNEEEELQKFTHEYSCAYCAEKFVISGEDLKQIFK